MKINKITIVILVLLSIFILMGCSQDVDSDNNEEVEKTERESGIIVENSNEDYLKEQKEREEERREKEQLKEQLKEQEEQVLEEETLEENNEVSDNTEEIANEIQEGHSFEPPEMGADVESGYYYGDRRVIITTETLKEKYKSNSWVTMHQLFDMNLLQMEGFLKTNGEDVHFESEGYLDGSEYRTYREVVYSTKEDYRIEGAFHYPLVGFSSVYNAQDNKMFVYFMKNDEVLEDEKITMGMTSTKVMEILAEPGLELETIYDGDAPTGYSFIKIKNYMRYGYHEIEPEFNLRFIFDDNTDKLVAIDIYIIK